MNGNNVSHYFLTPEQPAHRRYEALRAVFVEDEPMQDVAQRFDVSYGTIRNWASERPWIWDYKSLATELENIGFVDIRRANFGDLLDPRFNEVEEKHRWDNCLGMECKKPISGTAYLK